MRTSVVPFSVEERCQTIWRMTPDGAALTTMGLVLSATPEIGAATAVRLLQGGRFEAAADTTRRGGGSAMVVKPD
jgi:gamma-glutamyltranspeptidase / glutathione hydrolase